MANVCPSTTIPRGAAIVSTFNRFPGRKNAGEASAANPSITIRNAEQGVALQNAGDCGRADLGARKAWHSRPRPSRFAILVVQTNRQQNDDALQNPLIIRGDPAEVEKNLEHRDQNDAKERPENAAASPDEDCAAHNNRSDRLQGRCGANSRVPDSRLRYEKNRCKACAKARKRIDANRNSPNRKSFKRAVS